MQPVRLEPSTWSALVFWMTGALVVAVTLAAWQAVPALLLAFASVIFAVMLQAVARPMQLYLGLSRGWSLPLAGAVILAVPVVGAMLVGPELRSQLGDIGKAVPRAIETIERQFDINFETLIKELAGGSEGAGESRSTRSVLADILGVARTVLSNLQTAGGFILNGFAGLIVVIAGGVFLASDPERYRAGVVRLFPKSRREQIDGALGNCGRALDSWFRAQLFSMLAVGILAGSGAWMIGLPAPLAIGFLSGILEFFPIIGPWLGAIPVLLLAIGQGPQMIIMAALLLIAVQQLESNLITPLVQQSMTNLPPFVVLFGLLAFGWIFGLVGVIIAGPLTLVAYVLLAELYVNDTLGQNVEVPGEKAEEAEQA